MSPQFVAVENPKNGPDMHKTRWRCWDDIQQHGVGEGHKTTAVSIEIVLVGFVIGRRTEPIRPLTDGL